MPKVCVEFENGGGDGGEPAAGPRFYSQTIGDGTALTYSVLHGFGTSDLLVSLRDTATGELDVSGVTSINAADPDRVQLTFSEAPASSGVRVTVLAAPAT